MPIITGMPEDATNTPTQTWCCGMRHRGARALTAAERGRLEHARALPRHWLVAVAAAYGALWVVGFPLMLVFREQQHVAGILIMYVLVVSVLPGLPILLYFAIPAVRRWREASRDLSTGTAECFEPPGRAGDPDGPVTGSLVLASRSHRVLSGPAGTIGHRVHPRVVPVTEAHDWWIPVEAVAPGVALERRRMHAVEVLEVRAAIRESRRADLSTVAAIALAAVLVLAWRSGALQPTRVLPMAVALLNAAVCVRALWTKANDLFRSIGLDRDAREAVVLRLAPSEEASPVVEFLPHSKLVWREGGIPADWRGWPERSAGATERRAA